MVISTAVFFLPQLSTVWVWKRAISSPAQVYRPLSVSPAWELSVMNAAEDQLPVFAQKDCGRSLFSEHSNS